MAVKQALLADGTFILGAVIAAFGVYFFAHDPSPPSVGRTLRRRGVVLGLSGGVDSSVAALYAVPLTVRLRIVRIFGQ